MHAGCVVYFGCQRLLPICLPVALPIKDFTLFIPRSDYMCCLKGSGSMCFSAAAEVGASLMVGSGPRTPYQ